MNHPSHWHWKEEWLKRERGWRGEGRKERQEEKTGTTCIFGWGWQCSFCLLPLKDLVAWDPTHSLLLHPCKITTTVCQKSLNKWKEKMIICGIRAQPLIAVPLYLCMWVCWHEYREPLWGRLVFFSALSHSQCMQVLNIYERQEVHGDTKFKKENDLSFSVVLVSCFVCTHGQLSEKLLRGKSVRYGHLSRVIPKNRGQHITRVTTNSPLWCSYIWLIWLAIVSSVSWQLLAV